MYFNHFAIISALRTFYLEFHFPKAVLCQVCLKLAQGIRWKCESSQTDERMELRRTMDKKRSEKITGELNKRPMDHIAHLRNNSNHINICAEQWLYHNIYTYKWTNCTNNLRNACTRVNNYMFITTLHIRWS